MSLDGDAAPGCPAQRDAEADALFAPRQDGGTGPVRDGAEARSGHDETRQDHEKDRDSDPDVDANDEEPETGPLRRCVVTRARLPKENMFRFAVSPDRALIPDLAGKLPGRGIWLSASGDVIEGGGAKGRDMVRAIARAARGTVLVPPDLPLVLETALVRRISDFLGFARRAGQAIAGFEKARDWMRTHPTGLVLQASDGSEAERSRFRSAVRDTVPVLLPLTGADMGRVFRHENVVHVVVAPGKLADSLIIEAGRLAGLRRKSDEAAPPASTARRTRPMAGPRQTIPPEPPDGAMHDEASLHGTVQSRMARTGSPHAADQTEVSHGATGRETAGINDATGTNG